MKKIIFLLSLCFAVSGFAQEPLSLSDAIRIGLEKNFDIQIENKNVEVAEVNNNWGNAGLFPTLAASFTGSKTTFDNKETLSPFSILGKTITTQGEPSINLNWNLLSLYNIKITKRRLEQLEAESEGNASIVIANGLQSIILGYYISVLERDRLAQFQEQLDLSRAKYEKVKLKREMGGSVTSDVLLEEGNYLTDSTNFINQQLQYDIAISNLNFLLGSDDPLTQFDLIDDLDSSVDEITYDELLVRMEKENVDIVKQTITQEILGYDQELGRWDRLPSLTLGANYTYASNEQDVTDWPLNRRQITDGQGNVLDVLSVGNNRNFRYGVNFTVSFNLFNGGRINQAIQRAKINYDQGGLRLDRLKAQLRRDLKQAFDRYSVRQNLFQINLRREEAAEQNLEIAKEKFDNGSIDSYDYRTVQNNYLISSIQRLQSEYNLIDSKIGLLRLTGGLVEEYND